MSPRTVWQKVQHSDGDGDDDDVVTLAHFPGVVPVVTDTDRLL